jgi:hypothetical protein
MFNRAPNLLNSISDRSFHIGGLFKAILFLRLKVSTNMFAFSGWYSIVQSYFLMGSNLLYRISSFFYDVRYFMVCIIHSTFMVCEDLDSRPVEVMSLYPQGKYHNCQF